MKGLLSTLLCATVLLAACSPSSHDGRPGGPLFREVAEKVGLHFVHRNGKRGYYYMPEIMGAGGALLDYDRDGDLDLFLCQGYPLGSGEYVAEGGGGRLFRNELSERGRLRFKDVTRKTGIDAGGYGMGAAVGDINNDGFPDLYLTNFGSNQLYVNRGDGTFTDVTEDAGADDPRWSVSATFLDYDGDGWLDLFIGNYVDFSLATHKACYQTRLDYCLPDHYDSQPDRLLHNRGDGSFEDVTAASHIAGAYGKALGVVASDFNGDGLLDLYVACDRTPNQLWMNRGDGTFSDTAFLAGCALNHEGFAESSMGVDALDFDGDGDDDLFLTHLTGQTNTLYLNNGAGVFEDHTIGSGLGPPSIPFTGFGAAWFDYDNDTRPDLLVVNGAVSAIQGRSGNFPYDQPDQLFRNLGEGRFMEMGATMGSSLSETSRGALFGDLDNDGDVDVLVTNNNGRARLLLNQVGNRNRWIGLSLVTPGLERHALGARVRIETAGRSQWRQVKRNASYGCANDPRLVVGLGKENSSSTVYVRWLGGAGEVWENLEPGQWHILRKGEGRVHHSSSRRETMPLHNPSSPQ